MSVTFKDYSKEVLSAEKDAVSRALAAVGVKWQQNVTPLIPVDTGRLRASMKYEVQEGQKQVIVGSDVEYASYVELGTKRQKAKPYLKPSILDYREDYRQMIIQIFGG